jgi:spermidine dehydrogenase
MNPDRALGMDARMTRADFLDGLPHPMMAKEDWDGYGGVGDYANSNGNTHAVMTAGHGIRDAVYAGQLKNAKETGETFDCVVVGGGISGLAAAHLFNEKTKRGKHCLVLENHAMFGGEARRNEFDVDGHRLIAGQGSATYFPSLPLSLTQRFYESIGFDGQPLDYQKWGGGQPELDVNTLPYARGSKNSGMFFGAGHGHPEGLWLFDPWGKKLAGAPLPEDTKRQLLRAREGNTTFTPPKVDGDEISRALDRISFEQHLMERDGLTRDFIRTYMPDAADWAGSSADENSAYANYAPEVLFPWKNEVGQQIFPGGNTGVARFIVKAMIPAAMPGPATLQGVCLGPVDFTRLDKEGQPVRIRLNATVADVHHEGDNVRVTYAVDGRLYCVQARSVVMSAGWTTARNISDLPENYRQAYQQFHRMPCAVINVAFRNWRFMAKMGITECQWFEGVGRWLAVRKLATFAGVPPTISPDDPTVIRLKITYTEPGVPLPQQCIRGRMRLLSIPYSDYERKIREELTLMFARSGFDARRDIKGIIVNRWGHAYLCGQPGFFFGQDGQIAPREVMRRAPFGKIAFANSDLSGIMDHRASIAESDRAVGQLLA